MVNRTLQKFKMRFSSLFHILTLYSLAIQINITLILQAITYIDERIKKYTNYSTNLLSSVVDIFDSRNEILGELADSRYVLAGRQLGGGILLTMLSYWQGRRKVAEAAGAAP